MKYKPRDRFKIFDSPATKSMVPWAFGNYQDIFGKTCIVEDIFSYIPVKIHGLPGLSKITEGHQEFVYRVRVSGNDHDWLVPEHFLDISCIL